jgi:indolepyruvate ferredoxin oxidoreductase beta subunit
MTVNDNGRRKILLVGVGGQGVLTAARMLGDATLHAGHEVMVGQLHGMAQRGGSVEGSVLIGEGESAFVERGGADVVLGFEPLETLRALPRMSSRTKVVVNLGRVVPFPLSMQGEAYPDLDLILDDLRAVTPDLITLDGTTLLTEQVGNPKSLNILMLGVLASLEILPFDAPALWQAVELRTPPRFLKINQQAYELGLRAATRP